MIYASQDKESEGFVMILSIGIAVENIALLGWSVMLFAAAYKSERDAERARELEAELAANGGVHVQRSTLLDIVNDKRRWVQSRLSSKATRQARTRSRTVDSSDPRNQSRENPLVDNSIGIELPTINGQGQQQLDGGASEIESSTSGSSLAIVAEAEDELNAIMAGTSTTMRSIHINPMPRNTSST